MDQTTRSSGFTIIEVMLFLAITGLMMIGMLVGVGGSINRQRYEDAVYSFQDFLQGQYNLVDNVRNNHPSNYICSGGAIVDSAVPGGEARGTSEDCTVVGRLITTSDGQNFTSEPVFATSSIFDTTGSDATLLDSLQMTAGPTDSRADTDTYTLAWNTTLYTDRANPAASRDAQLLIFRMPTSGIIRTFFRDSTTGPLNDFWNIAQPDEIALCVAPEGLVKSNPQGIRVLADATNASSVQRIPAGDGTC